MQTCVIVCGLKSNYLANVVLVFDILKFVQNIIENIKKILSPFRI